MTARVEIVPLTGLRVEGDVDGRTVLTLVARAMRILREARRTVMRVRIDAGGATWTWPAASLNDLRAAFLAGYAGHYAAAMADTSDVREAFRDGVVLRRQNKTEDQVIDECMRRWP